MFRCRTVRFFQPYRNGRRIDRCALETHGNCAESRQDRVAQQEAENIDECRPRPVFFTGTNLLSLVVTLGRIIDTAPCSARRRSGPELLVAHREIEYHRPLSIFCNRSSTPAHHVHVVVTASLDRARLCQRLAHTATTATFAIFISIIAEPRLFAVSECLSDIPPAHVDSQTGPRPFGSGALSRCLYRRRLRHLGHPHGHHRVGSVSTHSTARRCLSQSTR